LLNKRGAFEKEGQRYTCKVFLVEQVGLNSLKVQGKENKINLSEVLKVSPNSQEIDNSLRKDMTSQDNRGSKCSINNDFLRIHLKK
jgi:hypothetical protein